MAIEIGNTELTDKVREFLTSVGLNDLRRISDNYAVRSEGGVTWLDISIRVNESAPPTPAAKPATDTSPYVRDSEGDIWIRDATTGEFHFRHPTEGTQKHGWNFERVRNAYSPLVHLDELP